MAMCDNDLIMQTTMVQPLRESIDLLFNYLRGEIQGVDIIECAAKIKRYSDALLISSPPLKSTPCSVMELHDNERRGSHQERIMAHASKTLLSLRDVQEMPKSKKRQKSKAVHTSQTKHRRSKRTRAAAIDTNSQFMTSKLKKARVFAKRQMSADDFKVLYREVQQQGGEQAVSKARIWKQIAKCIRSDEELKTQTSAGSDMKKIYSYHESELHEKFRGKST